MPRISKITDAPGSCAIIILRIRPIVITVGVPVVLRHIIEVVEELLRANASLVTSTLHRLVPNVIRRFDSIARCVILEDIWVLCFDLWCLLGGIKVLHTLCSLSEMPRGLFILLLQHRYLLVKVLMQLCIILDVVVHGWANVGF
jgi:hypothetical protein